MQNKPPNAVTLFGEGELRGFPTFFIAFVKFAMTELTPSLDSNPATQPIQRVPTPGEHLLLDAAAVERKIERMAYQIAEENASESFLTLAGVKNRGLALAHRLAEHLRVIGFEVAVGYIRMNKDNPVFDAITTDLDPAGLAGKVLIIVDDVANTGRTLLYAAQPFVGHLYKKMQVAVLIDRRHKTYPVSPDFFGMALSTTVQAHVHCELEPGKEAVYLR